ncbi:hypothetical protein EIP86_004238 [Pleurotus ostreatoroseus]|nr:hypothetical protein EIP86_004238 [Pleurotus ostreatoroseus]
MVGLTQNRSIQDEKLIEAIFQTHHAPDSRAASTAVYGATATNIIIDARPTTNAVANTAKGAGTENMDHYKDARKVYLGIDNIHTMRDSLSKVVEALRETELVTSAAAGNLPGESTVMPILDRQALRRSGWLKHLSAIMEGSVHIIRNVHVNSSHVLIHCSDGWDRTAQLSALSQICLDPYYRTIKGFQILIEKDWVSFGHKFLDRCGHLSSEKFFVAPVDIAGGGGGAEAAQAFFASVQNRFGSQKHLQETSPVFHQFLESVRQVQRQFPERFEFNERFLRQLHYHLYSCQFGTFLFNCERERRLGEAGIVPSERTASVWDFLNSPPETELNCNPDYDPSLDDPARREPGADMGVLFPNPKDVRFWFELYGRTDEEMNGKFVTKQVAQGPEVLAPVEGADEDPAVAPIATPTPPSPSMSPKPPAGSISPSLSRMALQRAASPSSPSISSSHSLPSPNHMTRHDSLRGLHGSGSSTNLRAHSAAQTPRSPSPSSSTLPSRQSAAPRQGVSDLFGGGGVRSMWDRFSSNASAALSTIQNTYEGVAKDLSKLSVNSPGAPGSEGGVGGGELKSRDEIAAVWAEDRPSSPSRVSGLPTQQRSTYASTATTTSSTYNPWSTTKPSQSRQNVSSMLFDNPWSSQPASLDRSPSPLANTLADPQPTRLPEDPAVALPSTILSRERQATASTSPLLGELAKLPTSTSAPMLPQPSSPPKEDVQPPEKSNTDPLGVGVW